MSSVGSVGNQGIEQIINVQKPQQNVNNQHNQQLEIKSEENKTKAVDSSPNQRIGGNIDITA